MKTIRFIVLLFFVGLSQWSFSQNNICANVTPFCTGSTMNFPAGVNAGTAQQGPFYGCLGTQPNPAWFFMQMANSGSMSISMSANSDIDFICWGPFPNMQGACNNLTQANVQSCSYSPSPTETCTIANAVAGQFYVLLITNFSNQAQGIIFNQNNTNNPGAAATQCSFVCVVTATNSGAVCAGGSATIGLGSAGLNGVSSFTWSGPSAFSSPTGTNVFTNITANSTYTLTATKVAVLNGFASTSTCQAVTTVSVVQYPTYNITQNATQICQNENFFANVVFSPPAVTSNFSYVWSPFSGGGVFQPSSPTTLISPPPLPPGVVQNNLVYTVTVKPTSTLVNCPVTKTVGITINNPASPTIALPPLLCNTFSTVQLTGSPATGTWSPNSMLTMGGVFDPSFAAIGLNTVTYSISVGNCVVSNTQAVSVSKDYSPALTTSVSTLCVQDPLFQLMSIVQNPISGTWAGPQVSNNLFSPQGLPTGNYSLTYSTTSLPVPGVCDASTVLVVPVFNPPVPVIGSIPPRCTNAGTFAITASPSTVTWTPAPGISVSGIQNTALNTIGTNTIICTHGQGTCVASSSKTFHVSQYNSATLTGSVQNLCWTNPAVNLMSIVQNTNGGWSSANYNVAGNVFNPAWSPVNTHTYDLVYKTYSTPDPSLCKDSTVLNVSVYNPPVPSITQAGPFCTVNNTVQLAVSPSIGSWVATSYLSSGGIFSPSLSSVGYNAVEYVIGTNTCHATQTKMISIEAFVPASITASIPDLCNTGTPLNLAPITLNNLGIWSGPGITGVYFDPGVAGSGKFQLIYNTSSYPSGLCPDQDIVSVNVFSLAIPTIAKVKDRLCNNSMPFQLQVSPVGGIFGGGVTGAINQNGMFNPASAMIGNNIVNYSITLGPCVTNTQITIEVEEFVSANFIKDVAIAYCENALPFNLNSLVKNPGFVWSINGTPSGNMFDPSQNIGDTKIGYTTHSYSGLCPDASTITIKVKKLPRVKAETTSEIGCAPLDVFLSSKDTEEGRGTWNFGDGISIKGLSAGYTFNNPGTYTVVFNYEDNDAVGCSTQVLVKPIQVLEKPHADFSVPSEEISVSDPAVSITNLSTRLAGNKYLWTIEGIGQLTDMNPVVVFPQAGRYRVTLLASTLGDCKDEVTKFIEVKNDFNVFIPNSFSPNFDGINDFFFPVFTPYGLDTKTYSLEIFDRWGKLIFSTNEYGKGWDGTVQNKGDEALKQDSYIYRLKYKDLDGNAYSKIGDVTLLR